MTKLTRFGYVINKNDYPIEKIECIKEDLTVKPFKMGNFITLSTLSLVLEKLLAHI